MSEHLTADLHSGSPSYYGGEHHTITARVESTGDNHLMMTPKELREVAALRDQLPALANGAASNAGVSVASQRQPAGDHPGRWLAVSMSALAVLAVAAAVVSYSAQYRMVYAAKGVVPVAALEAGIPDVAALVFATLGIALALHGKRAIRARVLNLGAVGTSVGMNVLASGAGWRDLAIWAMPPVAYALASDTAIGVVRAWTIARHKATNTALADDDATPLAIIGGFLLWVLRLGGPPSWSCAVQINEDLRGRTPPNGVPIADVWPQALHRSWDVVTQRQAEDREAEP